MEVQLYVYDLSQGMAKAFSRQFLGTQIDAVYHTSLVFNGVEYFFGAGVQTCYPGTTHHGQPMEKVNLGQTQLPMEVILDYLESLKQVYTPESYDLFAHNCNNFTNDFSMFLIGKGIPAHITSLPETVLNTPFGQMLKPQLDQSMRSITQAPVAPQNVPASGSSTKSKTATQSVTSNGDPAPKVASHGEVYNVTQASVLDNHLSAAKESCATIFFTSSTCAPCKIAYPTYDSLAAEYPKATFIKVDINQAHDIARAYSIRATPTFMTFYHGVKEQEWAGANPSQLSGNVRLLVNKTFPAHPHAGLRVPSLAQGSLRPVTFAKIPPLDKVISKMGSQASDSSVIGIKTFLSARQAEGAKEAPLPDLKAFAAFLRSSPTTLPADTLFTAYDLLRCALIDARVSGWFAEESGPQSPTTLSALLSHVTDLVANDKCPYNLRLVAIQLSCNLFSSPLSTGVLFSSNTNLGPNLVTLAASSLLAEPGKPAIRSASVSLAFDLAASNYRVRREQEREGLSESVQVELAASLLEMLGDIQHQGDSSAEKDKAAAGAADPLHVAAMALGYLIYFAPVDGEVWDLCKAMDAKGTVKALGERRTGLKAVARDVAECLPASE